jgi:hypothetical protein
MISPYTLHAMGCELSDLQKIATLGAVARAATKALKVRPPPVPAMSAAGRPVIRKAPPLTAAGRVARQRGQAQLAQVERLYGKTAAYKEAALGALLGRVGKGALRAIRGGAKTPVASAVRPAAALPVTARASRAARAATPLQSGSRLTQAGVSQHLAKLRTQTATGRASQSALKRRAIQRAQLRGTGAAVGASV